MQYIAHRVNTIEQLRQTPDQWGVEIDLRDNGQHLILQHDPFLGGENFEDYLKHFRHGTMILNIKSERIEPQVLEMVSALGISDYFLLDCSFPMIRNLVAQGEHRIAVRFSEFEPIELALSVAGEVDWVWIDCFTKMPLDDDSYGQLKEHFKLCAVSPELQGRSLQSIPEYVHQLARHPVDAVCTKRPDLWQAAMQSSEIQRTFA